MQGIASASSSRHLRALWRGRAGQRIAAAGLPGDGDERQLFIPAACGSRHHPYCIACRPEGGGRRRRRGQAYLSTANREAGDAAAGRTDGRPEEADADPPSCGTGQQATLAKNVAELSKARLSALVVSTTAFGFLAAGPAALSAASLPTFAAASVGTALCASSAATFNQVIESDRDGRMKRTAARPLVTGAVSPGAAVGLGCATGGSGALLLHLGTDPVTTALGLANIGLYAGLYTYLKPRSEANTWVGAVVGAVPPVMGWTAAGGSALDAEALLLGSTLFLWQFPHFFALNWMYRADYKRGGFEMVGVNDPTGERTAGLIKRYAAYLAAVPFVSAAAGVTSPMYAIDAGLLLNGYALHVAGRFDRDRSNGNARKVFLTSLWYLPCTMMLFLIHSRRWHGEVTDEDHVDGEATLLVRMQEVISAIRAKGRELCMHEALASGDVTVGSGKAKTALGGSKCPVSLGSDISTVQVGDETSDDDAIRDE